MAGTGSKRARDKEINRAFEKQQRRLNRKWTRNAASGFIVLVLVLILLQFTPYRRVPFRIFNAAKGFVKNLTTGKAKPAEPDPTYW
jgi:hypothetical protein